MEVSPSLRRDGPVLVGLGGEGWPESIVQPVEESVSYGGVVLGDAIYKGRGSLDAFAQFAG